MRKYFFLLSILFYFVSAQSQSFNHPTGGWVHQTITCGTVYTYYDNGGAGDYSDVGAFKRLYVDPNTPGENVRVEFTSFNVGTGVLSIFDGNGLTLIGSYSGSNNPGIIEASIDGTLVFIFSTNGTSLSGWEATVTCGAMAPVPGTATASPTTVCAGYSSELILSGYQYITNIQWQSSPDGIIWTDIAGANSDTYTVSSVTSTTQYRVEHNNTTVYSNIETVTVSASLAVCNCSGTTSATASSLIPNSSFEDMDCCPTSYTSTPPVSGDGFDCATNWIQASTGGTTDYYNCSFISNATPLPFPDGNGAAGFIWMRTNSTVDYFEYVGTDLSSALIAGVDYQLSLNMSFAWTDGYVEAITPTPANPSCPVEITVYGTPNTSDLPWTGTSCPIGTGSWIVLGTALYNPQVGIWETISINFTPSINISSIAVGGPCTTPCVDYEPSTSAPEDPYPYFFIDNLLLNTTSLVSTNVSLSQTGNYDDNDLIYTANTTSTTGSYQWYFNGNLIIGETGSTLDISGLGLGEGSYTVVFTDNGACSTDEETASSTLPVEFIKFNVENHTTCNNIEWTTTSEINNKYFTVEKSLDGYKFEKIQIINGAGNSNRIIEYFANDYNIESGISYYRLKQTDYDGKYSYSKIIAVESTFNNDLNISIFPNPVNEYFTIKIKSNEEKIIEIELINLLNKVVMSETIILTEETFSKTFSRNNIRNGVYLLLITDNVTGEITDTHKIIFTK